MPTYDYVCDACGHAFDHFQSMSSNVLRTCPECKKKKLRRLIGSGAGVIFKGSGFYETDYKRKSKPEPKGADGDGGESGRDGTHESKADSASTPEGGSKTGAKPNGADTAKSKSESKSKSKSKSKSDESR